MNKRIWSILLAAALFLSAAAFATPAALAADADPADVDTQIILIYSKLSELLVKDEENEWYYTVTDLDHNGKLEFVAAFQNPEDLSTSLKIVEVNEDMTALEECKLNVEEGKSFPDFTTLSARKTSLPPTKRQLLLKTGN